MPMVVRSTMRFFFLLIKSKAHKGIIDNFEVIVVEYKCVSTGTHFRNDLVSFGGSIGNWAYLGGLYEYSMGLTAGVPDVAGASNCRRGSVLAYSPSCPASAYAPSTDTVWMLGASFGRIVGGTLQAMRNQS